MDEDIYLKYDDKKIIETDPSDLTVKELKSILGSKSVELEPSQKKKDYFVQKYMDLVKQLKKTPQKKSQSRITPIKQETVKVSSTKRESVVVATPKQKPPPQPVFSPPTNRLAQIPNSRPIQSPPITISQKASIPSQKASIPSQKASIPSQKQDLLGHLFALLVVVIWIFMISFLLKELFSDENKVVQDETILREASKIINIMKLVLSKQKGSYICKEVDVSGLTIIELRNLIVSKKGYSLAGFEKSLELIKSSLEYGITSSYGSYLDVSKEDAILPTLCSIKIWISHSKWYLIIGILTIGIFIYLRKRFLIQKEEEKTSEILVFEIHSLLQKQKSLFNKSSSNSPNQSVPYIAVKHIRDSLSHSELLSPFNLKSKISIWNKVERKIEKDSRIRQWPLLFHGEQFNVWEWEAPVFTPEKLSKYETPSFATPASHRHPEIFGRNFQ